MYIPFAVKALPLCIRARNSLKFMEDWREYEVIMANPKYLGMTSVLEGSMMEYSIRLDTTEATCMFFSLVIFIFI